MTTLGAAVYLGLLGYACIFLCRRARSEGLLAPVVVGGALRVAVMAAAHMASVEIGDDGILFVDDRTYFLDAERIATEWRSGHLVDPGAYEYVGNVMFGFTAIVAGIFTLVGPDIFAAKLANALLGTATILLVGLLAGRVLGHQAQLPAAWIAALLPGLVWWSAPMLKEALGTFLVVAVLLAASYLPRRSAAAWLGAALALLVITRSGTAAALVASLAVGLVLAAIRSGDRRNLQSVVFLTGATLATGLALALVLSRGDLPGLFLQYSTAIDQMIADFQGSNPATFPLDFVKTFVTPLPWAFDEVATRGWDRGLYPGMWCLYALYPAALLGAWRMRSRPEIALIIVPMLLAISITVITSGFVIRQRSNVEPLIVVAAIAGAGSWRGLAQLGSVGLLGAAIGATAHTGSLLLGAAVVVGAVALLVWSARLPTVSFVSSQPVSLLEPALAAMRPPQLATFLATARRAVSTLRGVAPHPPVSSNGAAHVRAQRLIRRLRLVSPPPPRDGSLRSDGDGLRRAIAAARAAAPTAGPSATLPAAASRLAALRPPHPANLMTSVAYTLHALRAHAPPTAPVLAHEPRQRLRSAIAAAPTGQPSHFLPAAPRRPLANLAATASGTAAALRGLAPPIPAPRTPGAWAHAHRLANQVLAAAPPPPTPLAPSPAVDRARTTIAAARAAAPRRNTPLRRR